MLGPLKLRCLDQPISVSLEALVPVENFYRFLDAELDLLFVRTWVQERYAERGRPSIDPVVFFKLPLVMFFEGPRSERQLMRIVARTVRRGASPACRDGVRRAADRNEDRPGSGGCHAPARPG